MSRRWLCFGDSITEGYAVENETPWPQLLRSEYNVRSDNLGISGDFARGIELSIESALEARTRLGEKVSCVIMIGINDCRRSSDEENTPTSAEDFETSMRLSIKTAKQYCERVLLCEISGISSDKELMFINPSGKKRYFSQPLIKERNQTIRELAQEYGVEVVSIFDDFQNYRDAFLHNDGIHPNSKGQEFLARRIATAIQNPPLPEVG